MTTSTYDGFHRGDRPAAIVVEPKSHEFANSERRPPFAAVTAITAIAAFFRGLVETVVQANQRQALYRQLSALDDHILVDIGIRRTDIPRLVAQSYLTHPKAPEVPSAATRPDQLTTEEDLAMVDVAANDTETPSAA